MVSIELSFESRGVTLAGTLHLPTADSPYPSLVMLQGSGAADRESGGYFPLIREAFLQHGVAVYSFDKPGIGGSSGDWRHFGLFDRADQAQAAIRLLQARAELDPRRVGVWGHSQGAWVVQIVASRSTDLAFAVTSSGPAISPNEQDLYGVEHTLRAEGKSADEVERAVAFCKALHAAALHGDDYATVSRALLEPARAQPWSSYHSLAGEEDWGMLRRFATERYEPIEALARVQCPLLAFFGGLDVLLPAYTSATACGQALQKAGTSDATIVVFPQANHRLQIADGGPFVAGYLDLLADWTARRARKPSSRSVASSTSAMAS